MYFVWFLAPAMTAALLALAATPLVRRLAVVVGAIDHPNHRKVHSAPTARLGGVAIVVAASIVFAVLWLAFPNWPGVLRPRLPVGLGLGILPILAVSICDDIRPLPPWLKLAAHALGAGIAIQFGVVLNSTVHLLGHSVDIGVLAVPLSMLWLIAVTNAFNIVDGLDGLSAGLALISSGSLAAVFMTAHLPAMAIAALVIAGAILGFLPYNLYPARIFLGDTGATTIGFTLACFALRGGTTLSAGFATLLPVLVLGLPLAETLVSMVRRFVRRATTGNGDGIMQPDRNHFHHRLLDLGIGHRRAVLILYGVGLAMASCAMLSILMTVLEAGLLLMGLTLAGLVGLARLGYEEFAFIRNGVVLRFYEAPVLRRSLFAVFADLVLVSLAVYAAIVLKFEDLALARHHDMAISMVAVVAPITVGCFWAFGLYRGSWKVAGVRDFFLAALAVGTSSFLGYLIYQLISAHAGSLSLFAIYALVKVMCATGSRASYRVLRDKQSRAMNRGVPVLIYGAGFRGAAVQRELVSNTAVGMRPVGFIDDDKSLRGGAVNGDRIVGGVEDLEDALQRLDAGAVILSSVKISPERIAHARMVCNRMGVRLVRMQIRFEACGAASFGQEGANGEPLARGVGLDGEVAGV